MADKAGLLHWAPRILAILAIGFISLFALDAFSSEKPFLDQMVDYLIHLLPCFVLLIVLVIAWKRERLGGIIFAVLGLGLSPYVFMMNYRNNDSVWMSLGVIALITLPLFVIGLLFLWSHNLKQKSGGNSSDNKD